MLDASLHLARDPYRWIGRHAGDRAAFNARLLLQPTTFLAGSTAAPFFYSDAMQRTGAAPTFLRRTLFGPEGVQGLDDAEHRQRKALFLRRLGPDRAKDIAARAGTAMDALAAARPGRIVLQDQMELLLTRVVCDWAGIAVADAALPDTTRMLSRLFEHAGPNDPRHLTAWTARRDADRWAANLVRQVRDRRDPGSVLDLVAHWPDTDGKPLPVDVAAVELVNFLRPVVAISAFITFSAHALVHHPEARPDDDDEVHRFVQEVRRLYPFFPMLAAKARHDAVLDGVTIPQGQRVILEIRSVNRDPRNWDDPDSFRPDRFKDCDIGAFQMIPQGGGGLADGHRCPGEWTTIEVMEEAVRWLTRRAEWSTPAQDFELNMAALPALPRDRIVLDGLRPA
ncbi:fatty acid alpha hydroxylase, cytochrome P450 [Oceaniovalibus guishaninsula JLT2003]|uniref:Fatty acid alpha hydroxylase, cytochrome P450 n=1 Tax=Oceaniovalibus guishaninsula JLT2003 TaxID=1231392 RepID=K2I4N6_9RHOB|nr:cytochrome P450 [Oceaniovalibus guishaninsula]EKE43875.1 fatty acid alpha hydroxylase, cytochrome P450 [Oceaniovalibus guishaninsula JLT2003]